jgi:uncharacterized protein DUF4412
MHRFRRAAALAALPLLAAAAAQAQAGWEGAVTYKYTMEGKSFDQLTYVKGGRMRTEMAMGGHASVQITDPVAEKSYTIIPEQKKYLVTDIRELKQNADKLTEATKGMVKEDKKPIPKFTPTGRKETVAGHACEHYTIDAEPGTVYDFCIAKEKDPASAGFAASGAPSGDFLARHPEMREMLKEFKDGFFMLKQNIVKGGKTVMTMEVTSIEKKHLSEDLFRPPPGYDELKMPKIPGFPVRKP